MNRFDFVTRPANDIIGQKGLPATGDQCMFTVVIAHETSSLSAERSPAARSCNSSIVQKWEKL